MDANEFKKLLESTSVNTTVSQAQKIIDMYGFVGFLSYMQKKDGVITPKQLENILKGYIAFKNAVIALYNQNKSAPGILNIVDGTGLLGNIANSNTKILIYSMLQYYKDRVKYETSPVNAKGVTTDPGRTFIGFSGFDPNNALSKVSMDCDIMSIVAIDIAKTQAVNMDLLVNVNAASNKPSHANTRVESTCIERTNAKNGGLILGPITFVNYSGLSLIGSFFGTYMQGAAEKNVCNILDVQKGFLSFALGTQISCTNRLIHVINNFGNVEYNSDDYSRVLLSDYECVTKIFLELKTNAKIRFMSQASYLTLVNNIKMVLDVFLDKLKQLKSKRPMLDYTLLNTLIISLKK